MKNTLKPFLFFIAILFIFGCSSYKNQLPLIDKKLVWPNYNISTFYTPNKIKIFLIKDQRVPLIHMQMMIHSGKVQEPMGKEGLFELLAESLISGGSKKYPLDKFTLLFEERGADFDIFFSDVSGTISLTCLKEDFPTLIDAIVDLLKNPLLPEERIKLAKNIVKNRIIQENDSPIKISIREFKKLIYGKNSPYSKNPKLSTIEKITRKDLLNAAKKAFSSKNIMVGLEGDVDKNTLLILKTELTKLPYIDTKPFYFPQPEPRSTPKTFFINRPELNQATVIMGHLGGYRSDPNYPAIQVYNMILSGGFSGQLFQDIRTKKGLVYAIFGRYDCKYFYPGMFYIIFQTASPNVEIAINEVKKVLYSLQTKLTHKDINEAKKRFLNNLIFRFDHPIKVLERRMYYEFRKMDKDSFKKLIEGIKEVKLTDVKFIAKRYIKPDKMTLLIVGNKKQLKKQLSELKAIESKME